MAEEPTVSTSERISVLLALDLAGVTDLQTLMSLLQPGNPYGLGIAAVSREAPLVYEDAVKYNVDVVLLSPNLTGYTPEVIQRLFHHEEKPILTVAIVPSHGDWAVTMEQAGAVGHLNTPLTESSVGKLQGMLGAAIRDAYAHRTSDSYIPRISQEVAKIVDRGGWRRTTMAVWSPAGGVGKTTISANLAAAHGVIANKPTLLVDADMNKGDVHLLFDIRGEDLNIYAAADHMRLKGGLTPLELKKYLVPYRSSNLSVLCGLPQTWHSSEPCLTGEQGEAFITRVLELAGPMYDFVVFDLGQTYNHDVHLTVLRKVDVVYLVVNSTVTSVNAAHKALGTLRKVGLLEGDRLRVIVNKYHRSHGVDLRHIVEALGGMPIFAEIPVDEGQAVVRALNDGEPLVISNSKCPVALDLLSLAATTYPPLEDIRKLQAGKKGGLLTRLLGS